MDDFKNKAAAKIDNKLEKYHEFEAMRVSLLGQLDAIEAMISVAAFKIADDAKAFRSDFNSNIYVDYCLNHRIT